MRKKWKWGATSATNSTFRIFPKRANLGPRFFRHRCIESKNFAPGGIRPFLAYLLPTAKKALFPHREKRASCKDVLLISMMTIARLNRLAGAEQLAVMPTSQLTSKRAKKGRKEEEGGLRNHFSPSSPQVEPGGGGAEQIFEHLLRWRTNRRTDSYSEIRNGREMRIREGWLLLVLKRGKEEEDAGR